MVDQEEVIKYLKEIAEYFRECRNNASFASKAENHFWELQNAASEAAELLKAQEPKPPRFAVAYDKIFYGCDNCGKSLLVVANTEGINSLSYMPKYCPECGQAVKWDE